MKLSKMKWTTQCLDTRLNYARWEWVAWSGKIMITGEVALITEKGCKRNFEMFAKSNGIKDFKYV